MLKIIRWIGYTLLVVFVLIGMVFLKSLWSTDQRLKKKYAHQLPPMVIHHDSITIAEGKRLVTMKGCGSCHGSDLGGKVWLDNALLGRIVAPNLTKGKGGLPADYSSNDWLRSIHYGLKRDSTALKIMPAQEFSQMSESDLSAIIAYCAQLQPINRELPKSKLGFLAYILTEFDQIPLIPAEQVDHQLPLSAMVKKEISNEFGKYLSVGCEGCHRTHMKGGAPVAPGFPEVADITRSGNPGKWTEEQFIKTLKTGMTPEGKKLNPAEMPWTSFNEYTEIELKALHRYLMSL